MTGKIISAAEAERLGMVNRVVPRPELDEAAMGLAQSIADKNPLAVTMGRRSFYAGADMDYDQGLEHSLETMSALAATEEARERIRAFLGKSQPGEKGSAGSD